MVLSLFVMGSPAPAQEWQSSIVYRGTDGKLVYVSDAEGNRIPDFSFAGYRNGESPLPSVPVIRQAGPVPGDNTSHLQGLIAEAGSAPLGPDGFRGAILLEPGVYRISGTVRLNVSGLVLRGSGQGPDSSVNTIFLATGDSATQTAVLIVGGSSQTRWRDEVTNTRSTLISDTVLVGERSFEVADPAFYAVGDNIVITHPCTEAWLQAVEYGGTATDAPWTVGEQPIVYNRFITGISGSRITVDVPVFNHLIRSLAQSTVYTYARQNLRTQIGVEDLRIDIAAQGMTTDPNGDEHHAWDGVLFQQVEDAWARNITVLHFGQSGFKTATATRVTVDSCSALEPVSKITGERRYNFNTYTASQQILFSSCTASYGRHDFVSNGTSLVSGVVFTDCRSFETYASSEGHRRWSQGMLFDRITFSSPRASTVLGLYNRGSEGTGHGWAGVHCVAWNVVTEGRTVIVQRPPTAQNYAIGCTGMVTGSGPFAQPAGFIEGSNSPQLSPPSLYIAQLEDRLSNPSNLNTGEGSEPMPGRFVLHPNYPNPFNPSTTIDLEMSEQAYIALTVRDLLGRAVSVLHAGDLEAGTHRFSWNGSAASSGLYIMEARTREARAARRVILMR